VKKADTKNDDGGSSITDFFILGSTQFDHAFCGGMSNIDFSQNCMAVVSNENASHGVKEHFQHGFRPQTCTYDIGNDLAEGSVSQGYRNVTWEIFLTFAAVIFEV
jgi:hypothetical protein